MSIEERINEFKTFLAHTKEQIELLQSEDSPGKHFEELAKLEVELEQSVCAGHEGNVTSLIESAESIITNGEKFAGEYNDLEAYNSSANVHNKCIGTIEEYSSRLAQIIERKKAITDMYERILKKAQDYMKYIGK